VSGWGCGIVGEMVEEEGGREGGRSRSRREGGGRRRRSWVSRVLVNGRGCQ